jgi:uncharacterized protein (DUF983 family)
LNSKTCSSCGAVAKGDFSFYQHPAVIIAFLVCCAICFGFLRVLGELPVWLSVVLTIPIVLIFFAVMVKIASWSDCTDKR